MTQRPKCIRVYELGNALFCVWRYGKGRYSVDVTDRTDTNYFARVLATDLKKKSAIYTAKQFRKQMRSLGGYSVSAPRITNPRGT